MLNFDQLMAQATKVTKQQDASLIEKARQKRREDEERQRRELKQRKEQEEAQALLARKRELQERKQKALSEQKKLEKGRRIQTDRLTNKSRTTISSKNAIGSKKITPASFLPEKKKPVHMSFEDLMKKAKEQSVNKKTADSKPSPITKTNSTRRTESKQTSGNNDHHATSNLYHRAKRPDLLKPANEIAGSGLSARERARQMIAEPPRKLNVQKRDQRSISDVQREIRHSKGVYSDDESDRVRKIGKQKSPPLPMSRKRPLSPPHRPMAGKRPPMDSKRPPAPQQRRMPFSGRPLDPYARKTVARRRPREEEEDLDQDLAEFIVSDEDEDEGDGYVVARNSRKNSYSDEISKIFRYDRSRYANEPVWSDDDMEANASDVLREEKRSERIARREDLIEEQKELERLKKKKKT